MNVIQVFIISETTGIINGAINENLWKKMVFLLFYDLFGKKKCDAL